MIIYDDIIYIYICQIMPQTWKRNAMNALEGQLQVLHNCWNWRKGGALLRRCPLHNFSPATSLGCLSSKPCFDYDFFLGKITWLSFGYKRKWLSQMGMFGDAYWFPVHCHAAVWFPQTYTTRVGGMPASWLSSRHTSSKISRHTRLPSGDLIELWKMAIYSGFSHEPWRFSIVMLVITGGYSP